MSYRDSFLAALPEDGRAEWSQIGDLDETLAGMVGEARATFPELQLDAGRFIGHLAARAGSPDRLKQLHGEDLYLACGCAAGEPAALARLDVDYLAKLDGPLRRAGADAELVAEVKQSLRSQLLAGDAPGIQDYRGDGTLLGWLRIIAVRETVQLRLRARRQVPLMEALDLGVDADPELRYLRRLYRAEFAQGFKAAAEELTARERTLLKLQYVDGLTLDEVAAVYRVHRATAARWLAEAKSGLLEKTHQNLRRRLRVSQAEVESLVRLLLSDLEITLRRLLKPK